jgi:hypothetical protein
VPVGSDSRRAAEVRDGIFISPTGYGADLLGSEVAVQIGQGVFFSNAFVPVENDTLARRARHGRPYRPVAARG